MKLLMLCLIINCCYAIDNGQLSYKDVKLSSSSGLYVENIGKLNHYEKTWDVVSYINISLYQQTVAFLENTLRRTENFCLANPVLLNYQRCNTTIKIVARRLNNIKTKESSIKDLLGHEDLTRRQKRGWFNGIGTMFKTLIGTLDEDDAEYYNKAIYQVQEDEREVTKLLKEQTSVTLSAIRNFNKTISSLNRNEKIFSENFQKLNNFSNKLGDEIRGTTLKRQADDHLALLTVLSDEVDMELSSLVDAVLFAKNNVIHPALISPKNLLDQLTQTLPYLPSLVTYAAPLTLDHAHELMKLAEASIYYKTPNLICVISNPLIQEEALNLYNLIPLPIRQVNNSFLFIQPTAPYMGISYDKTQYTIIKDLNECKQTDNNYICHLKQPLYYTHKRPICEMEIVTVATSLPKSCDVRHISIQTEMWQRLNSANHWIYVINKPVIITVNCENRVPEDVILSDTGIFNLNKKCKAFTSTTVLIPFSSNLNNFTINIPPFNLATEDCCIDFSNKIDQLTLTKTAPLNINFDDLNLASHKLHDINRMSDNILSHKDVQYHYSIMYYVSTIFFSLITIYLIYKLIKCIIPCFLKAKPRRNSYSNNSPAINCNIFNICKETHTDKTSVSSIELAETATTSRKETRESRVTKSSIREDNF